MWCQREGSKRVLKGTSTESLTWGFKAKRAKPKALWASAKVKEGKAQRALGLSKGQRVQSPKGFGLWQRSKGLKGFGGILNFLSSVDAARRTWRSSTDVLPVPTAREGRSHVPG